MEKQIQLQKAIKSADVFLHLPIQETEYSPLVVAHPFFENAILFDGKKMFDALKEPEKYREYLKLYEEIVLFPCKSIEEILFLIRKPYRITYLNYLKNSDIITEKECGNLLAKQWIYIEQICTDANVVTKYTILKWLLAADKECLMEAKEDRDTYENLSETVTIYRGCRNQKGVKGFSWSLSKEVAEMFANRYNTKTPCLYRTEIPKKNIICYRNGRNEQEIIVDYRKLQNIEKL